MDAIERLVSMPSQKVADMVRNFYVIRAWIRGAARAKPELAGLQGLVKDAGRYATREGIAELIPAMAKEAPEQLDDILKVKQKLDPGTPLETWMERQIRDFVDNVAELTGRSTGAVLEALGTGAEDVVEVTIGLVSRAERVAGVRDADAIAHAVTSAAREGSPELFEKALAGRDVPSPLGPPSKAVSREVAEKWVEQANRAQIIRLADEILGLNGELIRAVESGAGGEDLAAWVRSLAANIGKQPLDERMAELMVRLGVGDRFQLRSALETVAVDLVRSSADKDEVSWFLREAYRAAEAMGPLADPKEAAEIIARSGPRAMTDPASSGLAALRPEGADDVLRAEALREVAEAAAKRAEEGMLFHSADAMRAAGGVVERLGRMEAPGADAPKFGVETQRVHVRVGDRRLYAGRLKPAIGAGKGGPFGVSADDLIRYLAGGPEQREAIARLARMGKLWIEMEGRAVGQVDYQTIKRLARLIDAAGVNPEELANAVYWLYSGSRGVEAKAAGRAAEAVARGADPRVAARQVAEQLSGVDPGPSPPKPGPERKPNSVEDALSAAPDELKEAFEEGAGKAGVELGKAPPTPQLAGEAKALYEDLIQRGVAKEALDEYLRAATSFGMDPADALKRVQDVLPDAERIGKSVAETLRAAAKELARRGMREMVDAEAKAAKRAAEKAGAASKAAQKAAEAAEQAGKSDEALKAVKEGFLDQLDEEAKELLRAWDRALEAAKQKGLEGLLHDLDSAMRSGDIDQAKRVAEQLRSYGIDIPDPEDFGRAMAQADRAARAAEDTFELAEEVERMAREAEMESAFLEELEEIAEKEAAEEAARKEAARRAARRAAAEGAKRAGRWVPEYIPGYTPVRAGWQARRAIGGLKGLGYFAGGLLAGAAEILNIWGHAATAYWGLKIMTDTELQDLLAAFEWAEEMREWCRRYREAIERGEAPPSAVVTPVGDTTSPEVGWIRLIDYAEEFGIVTEEEAKAMRDSWPLGYGQTYW